MESRADEVPEFIKKRLLGENRQEGIICARKNGMTLQAIGDVLGISRERVRQLEAYGEDYKPKKHRGPGKKTKKKKPSEQPFSE